MNRLLKTIVTCFTVVCLCPFGASAWAVVDGVPYSVDVTATMISLGSTSLTVTPVDGGIAFNPAGATLAAPWVRSTGYVTVQYSSTRNVPYVGVRIVSKNGELVPVGQVIAGCVVPALVDSDNDGAYDDNSYSGMIFNADFDLGIAGEDPSKRAALAWQVFDAAQPLITVPSVTIGPDAVRGGSVISDNSDVTSLASVGPWNAAWAYIGDTSDANFVDNVWDATTEGPSYSIVVSGFSDADNGYLAQHPRLNPANDPRAAVDNTIAVYLAARFANTNWGTTPASAPRAYLLPSGDYRARIYVEMIYDI